VKPAWAGSAYYAGTAEATARLSVHIERSLPEAGYPPEPFAPLFLRALDAGLHSVPHAAEEAGPASIRGALESLRAERLGHGVRVLEDPDLVAEVRDHRIPLEVCPSINVTTGIFPSLAEHPLPRLLEAGLVVTLNADVPAMMRAPVGHEYTVGREVFGLDDATLATIARAGIEASFMDADQKAPLGAEIDAWLGGGGGIRTLEGLRQPQPA
jgi:adenosine deaminase